MSPRLGKNLIFFRNLLMEGPPEERGKQGWHIRLTACYVWIWRAAFAFLALFLILMFFFHFCTWWPKRRGDALHYLGRAANHFTAYTLVPQSASQSSSQMFVFFTFHLLYFLLKSPSLLHRHLHNGLSFLHSVFIKSVLNLLHNYLPSFWPSCPILSFSIFLLLVPVCLKTIFTIGGQLETKYLVKQS